MTRDRLQQLEKRLKLEVANRQQLGGYNADAESIHLLAVVALEIIQHLEKRTPKQKSTETKLHTQPADD